MNMKLFFAVIFAAFTLFAFAQQEAAGPVAVTVTESEEYGSYLTDAEGRTLYLFVNEEMEAQDDERMTEGVRTNAAPCTEGCLEAWPPLTAEEVEAGEDVDAELLYVEDINGTMQVVYNGWPLYYFARDEEPGQIEGQGIGGAPNIWYIVSPEGQAITDEGTEEGEGAEDTEGAEGAEDTEGAEGTEDTEGTEESEGTEDTEGTEESEGAEDTEGTEDTEDTEYDQDTEEDGEEAPGG